MEDFGRAEEKLADRGIVGAGRGSSDPGTRSRILGFRLALVPVQ